MSRVATIALDLIEGAGPAISPGELGRRFFAALRPFGARALYARANPSTGPACEHVYSRISPMGWEDIYAEPRFARIDFLGRMLRRRADPFAWRESEIRSAAEYALLEATRDFGISDGLAVPCHGPGGYTGLTSIGFERMDQLAPGERTAIGLAAFVLHHRMRNWPQDARRATGLLSPRERDCLAFLAEGSTDADVAARLGIGEATVVTHIVNARRKLGARNRTHAVALALALGLL